MRRLALIIGLVILASCTAFAQGAPGDTGVLGFVFAGPGKTSLAYDDTKTLHVGGGVEAIFWKGVGAGAEVGFLAPMQEEWIYGVGILSLNGVYEPLKAGRRATPFVSGGSTIAFANGFDPAAVNVGGGLNYWTSERIAFRVEFRDHILMRTRAYYPLLDFSFWNIRAGVTWR